MMAVRLNSDKEVVKRIKEGLKMTGGYCPCVRERTEDTKCMCKDFLETEEGMCHCGLYIKTS